MESKTIVPEFRKVNVGLVVLLSFVSLGIYLGYWFLARRRVIRHVDEKRKVPIRLWWIATIYLVLSLLLNFFSNFFLTAYGSAVFQSIDIILSFYFLGLLYYSVFRLKEALEDEFPDVDLSNVWTLLFHVWYLQFKINRFGGEKNAASTFEKALS